jgi:methyltransferase (TIGR00027 family)
MLNAVQLTSLLTAFWRYCEFNSAVPLCKDPHAAILIEELLPAERRLKFEKSPLFNAGLEILACRTRAIDDWLLEGTSIHGIDQVVMLGAGMDTRAYRMALGTETKVFEVEKDLAVLGVKHDVLRTNGIDLLVKEVVNVAADVTDTESLKCKLLEKGLHPEKKTIWIAEGLLEYLPLATQGKLFSAMGEIAGTGGSRVGMQVLDPSFGKYLISLGVDLPYQDLGEVDFTKEKMKQNGWQVEKVWDSKEFSRQYGRNPHQGFHLLFGNR